MRLVCATHPELEGAPSLTKKYLKFGASPRAAQALVTTAKVKALTEGRYNVSLEDLQTLAYPVLRHRVKLNFNAVSEQMTADEFLTRLLKELGGKKGLFKS
jgi:MoxR-like ATPase